MSNNRDNQRPSTQKKLKGWVGDKYVETITIDGIPYFLCFNKTTGKLEYLKYVNLGSYTIIPFDRKQIGHIPYSFTKEEIDRLVSGEISKEKLLDEILEQINRYIVAPEIVKYLILGDILFSYCLEWISIVHYLFFVGDNESGKSGVSHLARWLAYRCHFGEDIPMADIYNYLGTDEEGAGTIAEDEAQDIDSNGEKIRMYKSSYAKGSTKARMVGVHSLQKQQVYYFTFCPKWFAGERVPDDKGFRERLVIVYMIEGSPTSNIKKPNEKEKKDLLSLRNMLLAWKIQNMGKGLEIIPSGLTKRNQELWEDYLSVMHNTKYYEKYKEVVAHYVNQRKETIKNSFEAKIFELVYHSLNENLELEVLKFWGHITSDNPDFPGKLDDRQGTFYPDEHSKITKNSISRIFTDKFGAEKRSRLEKGSKVTFYAFKKETVELLAKKYHIEIEN